MEKKAFIEPEVTKVEFDFSEAIAASPPCEGDPTLGAVSECRG